MKAEQNICQIGGTVSRSCSCLQEAHPHCEDVKSVPKPCLKQRKHGQVGFDCFNFQEHIHDSFLASVNTNGLDACVIQHTKVDLG